MFRLRTVRICCCSMSYVFKMKDHNVLYHRIMEDVSRYDIGHKYMGCLKVNVPEMVLEMSDFRPSHTLGATSCNNYYALFLKNFRNTYPPQLCVDKLNKQAVTDLK